MRILQLCNKVPYPPKDGGSLATWQLTTGLTKLGCTVDVIALNTTRHRVENNPDTGWPIMIRTINHDTRIRYWSLICNLIFSREPYNLKRFYTPALEIVLQETLRNGEYDLVLLEGLAMTYYIRCIRSHSDAQIVLRAHNVENHIWNTLARTSSSLIKSSYYAMLAKRILDYEARQIRSIDALVTISQKDLEVFVSLGYSGLAHSTPFAPDPDMYSQSGSNEPHLLFLGALDWNPNIEGLKWFVQHVWTGLKDKRPGTRFYVAGRNPSRYLARFLRKSEIDFLGELEEIEAFYRKGRIFVVPLFAGSGMRVKIIESMARTLCVVTTTMGLEGIPATPGLEVVIANSDQEFLETLTDLIDNHLLCKEIGVNARQFIQKNFNNFNHIKELLNFFNSLTG